MTSFTWPSGMQRALGGAAGAQSGARACETAAARALGRPRDTPFDVDGRALVEACLRGEAQAWERFVERYVPLIRAVARRTLRSRPFPLQPEDLDDITENTLFAFIRDGARLLARYDDRYALSTYVGMVARTHARRHVRRKRHARVPIDPIEVAAERGCPIERLAASDRRRVLAQCLGELTPRDRAVLTQFYFEGNDYRQIADALGVSVNSVGAVLHRARGRLRARLEARGLE